MDPNPAAKRPRGNPNMVKGAPSVNPSGRAPGAAGLARYVAERTNGGQELVDRLLEIAKSDKSAREAANACVALLNRMIGLPVAAHELSVTTPQNEATYDFSRLSIEERRDLLARIQALRSDGEQRLDEPSLTDDDSETVHRLNTTPGGE